MFSKVKHILNAHSLTISVTSQNFCTAMADLMYMYKHATVSLANSDSISACDCNGRAMSCHYNATKGYGVCGDCAFPTTGDKCEWCTDFYYKNPDYAQNVTSSNETCTGKQMFCR